MTFIEWYASLSACFGTPIALVMTAHYMNEQKKPWPSWSVTAAWWLAGIAWLLGMGYILSVT